MITAILFSRPWLPRYKVQILDSKGRIILQRKFWSRPSARAWLTEWRCSHED